MYHVSIENEKSERSMKHMIAKKAKANNETIAYAIGSGTPVANAYNLKLAALNDAVDG